MAVTGTALWGEDHPQLGQRAVQSLDEGCAVGLSAGRLPKSYGHLDPNEDAILALADGDRRLLAVADGHNGANAARAALEGILDVAQRGLAGQKPDDLVSALLRAGADAVTTHIAGCAPPRDESRCALSIAVVADGRVLAATWGDTTVARVRPGKRAGVQELTGSTGFLGPNPKLPRVSKGRHRPGDAVVVCSDGITDFLGTRWREQLQESVERSSSAAGAVRELMERACLGGAGDHLSVGVYLT